MENLDIIVLKFNSSITTLEELFAENSSIQGIWREIKIVQKKQSFLQEITSLIEKSLEKDSDLLYAKREELEQAFLHQILAHKFFVPISEVVDKQKNFLWANNGTNEKFFDYAIKACNWRSFVKGIDEFVKENPHS